MERKRTDDRHAHMRTSVTDAGRDPEPRFTGPSRRLRYGRIVAGALVLLGGMTVGVLSRTLWSSSAGAEQVKTVFVPAPPPLESVYDTLGSGETLAQLMADRGLTPQEVVEVIDVVRAYKNPRSFRAGIVTRFSGLPGARPSRISLQLNGDSLLRLVAADSGWVARVDTVPITVDTLHLAGLITSSLWFAELTGEVDRLGKGEFQEYVFDLADVFAWKIDFTRDIREGDGFRVAIQREVRPDGSVRTRRFLAIELRNRGRVLTAIPFTRPDGRREYFDTEGEALRGVFLRYPVPYRITSGFSNRRYHPILKRYRRHPGIDYGAPLGTPVRATAAGTVARAGTWGTFGRIVEIRHTRGIRTRYAHLSSISSGIRAGTFVQQGQIIGRVGSTGLATGPHLHYEFLQNGAHRNPATMNLPSAPALESQHMDRFRLVRDDAIALLARVELPALPSRSTVSVTD